MVQVIFACKYSYNKEPNNVGASDL